MKIFCVGLSKTGTNSLTDALNILGYNAVHWHYTRHVFRYNNGEIEIDFEKFNDYDAFADTPIARIYPQLDAKFPGSKFILTLRDISKWERSFESQFGKGTNDQFESRLHRDLYGTDHYDHQKCVAAFERHTQEVRSYFKGREHDLLIMDVTKGDGWSMLCPFLGKPIPNVEFPVKYTKEERGLKHRLQKLLKRPQEIPSKVKSRLKKF